MYCTLSLIFIWYDGFVPCFRPSPPKPLQNQTKNLNDVIDNSYEHVVYIPKKCTANVQDISSFLSCRCTPDSIVSSSSASSGANQGGQGGMMKHNEDDSTAKYTSAGKRVIEEGQDDDDDELGEENKAQTASELLGRYEQKVFALASEFEEGMVRFWRWEQIQQTTIQQYMRFISVGLERYSFQGVNLCWYIIHDVVVGGEGCVGRRLKLEGAGCNE